MIVKHADATGPAHLEQTIKHRIIQRTGTRIQGLEIEVCGGRIEICGRAVSFHLKQLAIPGAFEVIDTIAPSRSFEVDAQIPVRPAQADNEPA